MTRPSITFNDGTAATLTNGKPEPSDRFANWNPSTIPYGDEAARQSDHAITLFELGCDYAVRFELPMIPSTGNGSRRSIAERLVAHLIRGGTCAVYTGDASDHSYTTMSRRPGTTPTLTLSDRQLLEYTLSLELINRAGSPGPCDLWYYDS